MERRNLTRKEFLGLGGTATGAVLLAACDMSTSPGGKSGGSGGKSGKKVSEVPMLAKQVTDGKLPAMKDRLPKNPRIIKPLRDVGVYGGTWRTVLASLDTSWLHMTVLYGQHLVHWDTHWTKVIPHVTESWEIENDAREYDFTLREGTKWSDGQPFTADDLVFWRDAYYTNTELIPVVDVEFSDDGEAVAVDKVDDLHVRFTFKEPHGTFLENLAFWQPALIPMPSHYLKKFHKDYNPDVESEVKKAKVKDWTELFFQKMDPLNNTELPTMNPWVAENPWNEGQLQTWVRNPFYPCTDTQGNQLPYIDKVTFRFFRDPQPLLLTVAHGDVDMYQRSEITIPKYKPVLARSAGTGGYKLVDIKEPDQNTMGICFNLTHKDPVKRRIFQNKDFRIGLSYAINRPEIISAVYQRQGTPAQTAPRPEVPFYDDVAEEMAKQYTEYDPDQANARLDKAGFTQRDGEGRRIGPNGEPIIIEMLTQTRYPFMADALELVKQTWAKVGIQMNINNVDSTLVGNRLEANEYDVTVDHGELGYLGMINDPRWLFCTGGSSYAPLWSNWFEGGTPSEEPPAAMRRQMQIWREEVFPRSEMADQIEGMRKIVAIAKDQFWTMGISLPNGSYAIVANRMHNVPGKDQMWLSFACPYPAAAGDEQFYIQE